MKGRGPPYSIHSECWNLNFVGVKHLDRYSQKRSRMDRRVTGLLVPTRTPDVLLKREVYRNRATAECRQLAAELVAGSLRSTQVHFRGITYKRFDTLEQKLSSVM